MTFACQDDKHSIKVGEPGFPVAAVERGKQVLVGTDTAFCVGDHDFTKSKIIPSVTLLCNVPESITETFYSGKVLVMLKDAVFEPSSPLRHCSELLRALEQSRSHLNPILCLYTDGGPDHRTTYLSVQIALIGLFRLLDLDMLVAARTAPHNSYRNPVERMMSLINIGLQSVGIMRQQMPEEMEKAVQNANNMEEIRKVAQKIPAIKENYLQSLVPTRQLLSHTLNRLSLKGEPVVVQDDSTDVTVTMDTLFAKVMDIEPSLQKTDTQQRHLLQRSKLVEFMEHCCTRRRYFFSIKKCGSIDCHICKPPRLSPEVFSELHQFPDPIRKPASESYKAFEDIWGEKTTEKDRPSLIAKNPEEKSAFQKSGESVRDLVVCGECLKSRCVYAAKALTSVQRLKLTKCKDDHIYVCGSTIIPQESELASVCLFETGINCDSDISSQQD